MGIVVILTGQPFQFSAYTENVRKCFLLCLYPSGRAIPVYLLGNNRGLTADLLTSGAGHETELVGNCFPPKFYEIAALHNLA
jgi:hypothetical protein